MLLKSRLAILNVFAKIQRPLAWIMLVGGIITFVGIITNVIATGDTKPAALLAATILMYDGISAAAEVENELDSAGAASNADDEETVP